jgi:outer membrane protein assembly factor BamB
MSSEKLVSAVAAGWLAVAVACGPPAPARVLTPAAAPPPAPPKAAPIGPLGWEGPASGAGLSDDPGPLRRPAERWRQRLDGPVLHPLSTDGRQIYAVAAGRVYAVDAAGADRWRSQVGAVGPATPTPGGVAVPTSEGQLLVLDAERGLRSAAHTAGGSVVGAPLPRGDDLVWANERGQVLSASGFGLSASDSTAGGLSADDGQLYMVTTTGELIAIAGSRVAWRAVMPGPGVGRPAVAGDTVYAAYAAVSGRPGGIVAAARADGRSLWRAPLDDGPVTGPSVGSVLVVPDESGALRALDRETGDRLWDAPVEGALNTRPLITQGSVFVGNADGRVHRFDPDDGGEAWSVDLGATVSADPVLLGDLLVVGLSDGSLVGLGPG